MYKKSVIEEYRKQDKNRRNGFYPRICEKKKYKGELSSKHIIITI